MVIAQAQQPIKAKPAGIWLHGARQHGLQLPQQQHVVVSCKHQHTLSVVACVLYLEVHEACKGIDLAINYILG